MCNLYICIRINYTMKPLDFANPVKLKNPQPGEENLTYQVTNFNEVTNRCYIQLVTPLPGLNMNIAPQEIVSIEEIENED